jgi:glycosyltransferase involved in cell wall biosynthesis
VTAVPFFSVVIPVYNRAAELEHALSSVLAQTCQDFEIVVIDDGSTDDPAASVLRANDGRIRLIRQENRGGGAARNRGIDEARGQFVALLDSDDRFLPTHLETMKPLLAGRSNVLGYAPVVADRGRGRTVLKPLRRIAPGEHMAMYLLCDRGFIPTMTMVVDTAIARRVRFPENLRCAEDTDFAIRLYLAGCAFVMADAPGAIWRDTYDASRASAGGRRNLSMIEWIEDLRPRIPSKAYFGCYGWAIAKSVATTAPLRALRLYLAALGHRCYRIPVAGIVFLQIFLPDGVYRWVSDTSIAWFGAIWDGRRRTAPAR